MLKSYLKLAWRNLLKNRLFSIINILGLSIAIGCSIVVFVFIEHQYGKDAFHENAENIFLIENIIDRSGHQQVWGDSPLPLGAMMRADFPQLKHVVSVGDRRGVMRYKDKVFDQFIRMADPEFMEMFNFPLESGDKNALRDPKSVIISEEIATKYFGEISPLEKQITITFSNGQQESYFVKGIAKKFPRKASFAFDILMNLENLRIAGVKDFNSWKNWTRATFIELNDTAELPAIEAQMGKYIALQNKVNPDWSIAAFRFDNLLDLALNSYNVRGDISGGQEPTARVVLSIIGIALLMLACFNYMNIAIASATRRLKEIGIRKVIGSRKSQLIFQFLGENLLVCFIALIIGVFLGKTFFIPAFTNLFPGAELTLNLAENANSWLFLLGILLTTGLLAGAYPAFFVSAFRPVAIFSSDLKMGSKSLFTKILLSVQFGLAFILITAAVVFTQNADYMHNRDWGYNQSQTFFVPLNGEKHFERYKNAIADYPHILSYAGGRNHIGYSRGTAVTQIAERQYEIEKFDIGENYLETVKVPLVSGRTFDKNLATDDQSILVNETLARHLKWEDPLNMQLRFDSTQYNVIGVVADFHHDDFHDAIEPTIFRFKNDVKSFNYLIMHVEAGKVVQTADFLKSAWKSLVPDVPYRGKFQSDHFAEFYMEQDSISKLFTFIALVAIILSCMGLFGLVSLNIAKRMKEISIRKVLGANIFHITRLVNQQFIWLLLIAALVATPLGYFALSTLLDTIYEYHITLASGPFISAAVLLFLTAMLTISSQIYKAVTANPVNALRRE